MEVKLKEAKSFGYKWGEEIYEIEDTMKDLHERLEILKSRSRVKDIVERGDLPIPKVNFTVSSWSREKFCAYCGAKGVSKILGTEYAGRESACNTLIPALAQASYTGRDLVPMFGTNNNLCDTCIVRVYHEWAKKAHCYMVAELERHIKKGSATYVKIIESKITDIISSLEKEIEATEELIESKRPCFDVLERWSHIIYVESIEELLEISGHGLIAEQGCFACYKGCFVCYMGTDCEMPDQYDLTEEEIILIQKKNEKIQWLSDIANHCFELVIEAIKNKQYDIALKYIKEIKGWNVSSNYMKVSELMSWIEDISAIISLDSQYPSNRFPMIFHKSV